MTYIAQRTHLLPSGLDLPSEDIYANEDNPGFQGKMRAPALQGLGGSAVITSARFFDRKNERYIKIAVKYMSGQYTEETHQASNP